MAFFRPNPFLAVLLLGATAVATTSTQAQESTDVFEALKPAAEGLTTDEVVRRALETSPSLDSAELDMLRAQQTSRRRWLGYVPRIDLSGSYTRLSEVDQPPFDIGGGQIDNPFPVFLDFYSFDASINVPVSDYFLLIIPGAKATRMNADVMRYQRDVERETTALTAIEAYLNWVRARASLLVAEASVAGLSKNLEEITGLADAGFVADADRLLVRSQLANARVAQERAAGGVKVAETYLRRLLGLKDDDPLVSADSFFETPDLTPPEREQILASALEERSEIRALKLVVTMQEKWLRYYQGARYPKVALNGAAKSANPNDRYFPPVDEFNETWLLGASVRWSPNDYITARESAADTRRDLRKSQNDLRLLEDGLRVEVDNAVTFYDVTRRSIVAAADAVEAAEREYTDRQTLLGAGEATTAELLMSESSLRNAQLQLVNAYLDLRFAQAQLDRAVDRLAPPTHDEPNSEDKP